MDSIILFIILIIIIDRHSFSSSLSPDSLSALAFKGDVTLTHLLLRLQALRVDSSHVVGFCADIIVSFVLDKVHTGVICGLYSHIQMSGTYYIQQLSEIIVLNDITGNYHPFVAT